MQSRRRAMIEPRASPVKKQELVAINLLNPITKKMSFLITPENTCYESLEHRKGYRVDEEN